MTSFAACFGFIFFREGKIELAYIEKSVSVANLAKLYNPEERRRC